MSDTVLIVLIVAVIAALFIFRSSLSRFLLKANKGGVEAELQTREASSPGTGPAPASPGINISGNRQIGRDQQINVGRDDVNVQDNTQLGQRQQIDVKPDQQP